MKNSVIGSNRQKGSVIAQGVVTRLTQLLQNVTIPTEIRIEAAVTLGSLAKGTESHVKQLIDFGIAPLLLSCTYFKILKHVFSVFSKCFKSC